MKREILMTLLLAALCLLDSVAWASTIWYVNGVSGSDGNDCKSPSSACKTIGHGISLAASGDTIKVATATYTENLSIGISLRILGAGAKTTFIDGGEVSGVVKISSEAHVTLSGITFQNGRESSGGGIYNLGILTLTRSAIRGNSAIAGGGLWNEGTATVNSSTISANSLSFHCPRACFKVGGGVANLNGGHLIVNNSTISENTAPGSGAIFSDGTSVKISNSTIAGNTETGGAAIYISNGTAALQNTIVANNSNANCSGTIKSKGYNLSSDTTCNFSNAGDLNNTDPQLGPLQYNGGPTQTIPLLAGSPAIDAGNPSGCTDGVGHVLTTDQRGKPRPDAEDTGGCDIGAYERQSD